MLLTLFDKHFILSWCMTIIVSRSKWNCKKCQRTLKSVFVFQCVSFLNINRMSYKHPEVVHIHFRGSPWGDLSTLKNTVTLWKMEVYCHGLSHQTPFLGKALHLLKDYPPKKENNFSRQHLKPHRKREFVLLC